VQVADAVLPREQTVSATRARDPSIRPAGTPGATGITLVKPPPESKWQRQWLDMQQKVGTGLHSRHAESLLLQDDELYVPLHLRAFIPPTLAAFAILLWLAQAPAVCNRLSRL